MSNRPILVAIASAVAVAVAAGGALVAQSSGAAAGPASPERAVLAFVDGMAAGDPATCGLLTDEARTEAMAATPDRACEDLVEEVGRQHWMADLAAGSPTVTTAGDGFTVVRYDLPSADVFWFRAVQGPHGWLLQRGPWDDARSA